MKKEFTKADLRDGYIITYKSTAVRTVKGNELFSLEGYYENALSHWNDDLTHSFVSLYAIIRVECPQCGILWEREGFETAKEDEGENNVITLHGHPVKVGDKVFSVTRGWGEVIRISESPHKYPIKCSFNDKEDGYSISGKYLKDDNYPLLGWQEEYDIRKLKDTKPSIKVEKWKWVITGAPNINDFFLNGKYLTEEEAERLRPCATVLTKIEPSMILDWED